MNNNDYSNPHTGSFGPVEPPQQPQAPQAQYQQPVAAPQPMYQQPVQAPMYAYPAPYPPQKSGTSGVLMGLIAFLVLVLVAAAAAALYIGLGKKDTVAAVGAQTSTVVETAVVPAQGGGGGSSSAKAGGSLSSAWAGTSVTSAPFVERVRQSYVAYRNQTGAESGTINAYSPVTGRTYSMWCRPSGGNIKCSGGNNAVVIIGG